MFGIWGIPGPFRNSRATTSYPRGMTATMSAALSTNAIAIFHLYEGQFPDGTVRLTDLPYAVDYNSETFTGAGGAIGFEPIEEVGGLQSNAVKVYFNACDASLLAVLQDQNLIDRTVIIRRGLLDSSNQVIADPFVIFEGKSDSLTLAEDVEKGSMTLALSCLDENADFNLVNCRKTNNQSQQQLFPGDKGFSFIAKSMDRILKW